MSAATRMGVAAAFRDALPVQAVNEDATQRALLSADIAGPAERTADLVLAPGSEAELRALIHVARSEGVALFARGGGWSYTGGHMPSRAPSAIVDTRGLGGIAINHASGSVSAGAGVTWAELHAALDAHALRLPSFGPLSGLGATLGGGISQDGGFFGAATHGPYAASTLLGCRMLDGTGETVLLTRDDRLDGALAPQPLAGDSGAFGIRSAVTLQTIARPPASTFLSFGFSEGCAAVSALAALAGAPALGEAFVFDPGTHANLARGGFSLLESASVAGELWSAPGSWRERLTGLLSTARAGRAVVAELRWSLHLSLDGTQDELLAAREEALRRVAPFGPELLPDAIPRVTRARPFRPIKALLGPAGELWLPVHGHLPAAQAPAALAALQATLADAAEAMQAQGVRAVLLGVLMGSHIVLEPQLFWPDALTPLHRALVRPEQLAAHGDAAARPASRALAHHIRARLIATLADAGASHFQLGRTYAPPPGLAAGLRALKARHDPYDIMNPGVLGL
jgi:FAD/FMN-containing dehydrogenase